MTDEPPKLVAIEPEPLGQSVVEVLQEIIAAAERGEVSAVAVAIVLRNGKTETRWSYIPSLPMAIGAASQLVFDLTADQAAK